MPTWGRRIAALGFRRLDITIPRNVVCFLLWLGYFGVLFSRSAIVVSASKIPAPMGEANPCVLNSLTRKSSGTTV